MTTRDKLLGLKGRFVETHILYYARGAQGVQPTMVGVRPVNWIYRL